VSTKGTGIGASQTLHKGSKAFAAFAWAKKRQPGQAWNQPESSPAWPNSALGTSLSKNNYVTYGVGITAVLLVLGKFRNLVSITRSYSRRIVDLALSASCLQCR